MLSRKRLIFKQKNNCLSRILSLILIVMYSMTVLPLSAAAIIPDVKADGFSYEENFNLSTISERITLPESGAVHEDGVLKISQGSAISFDVAEEKGWSGLKFFSMKLKKPDPSKAISVHNENAQFKFYWHIDGLLKYQDGTSGGALVDHDIDITAGETDWITVNCIFNTENGNKYTLWIEDAKDGVKVNSAQSAGYLVTSKTFKITAESGDIWVDDIIVYDTTKESVPGGAAVLWDEPSISLPGTVSSSIELPAKGEYGSDIIWESSDETVLTDDGTVISPKEDTSVTMKATFSKDGETNSREFEVVVKKSTFMPDSVDGGFSYRESFNDSEISERITLPESGAVHEDGVLKISKGSAVSFDVANDKGWSGIKYFSMRLKKTDKSSAISVHNENAQFKFYWHIDGVLKYQNGKSGGVFSEHSDKIVADQNDWISVKGIFNADNGYQYALLIEDADDGVVLNNAQSAGYLVTSKAFKINAETCDVWVDDIVVFDAEPTSIASDTAIIWDEEIIKKEGYLSGVDKLDVEENLFLPTVGTYGSVISWDSSEKSVISDEGVVTKGQEDTTVILTATITNNDAPERTHSVELVVKGEVSEEYIKPVVDGDYIYNEDFSSISTENLADAGITASGSVVVENEALKLTRDGIDTTAEIKYTQEGMKVPTGYRFNLKKSNSSSVVMMRTGCGALQFYWHAGGDLVIYNGTKSDLYKGVLDKNEVSVWVLSNPELDKHSLWIDEYEVGTWNSVNNRTNETNELSFTLTGADGNLMIDDFKVFDSTVPVSSLLAWTEGVIRDTIPTNVKSDISFITEGVGGSLIEWESSDEDVISLDGKVVRGEGDIPVTLTATITNSGETRTAIVNVTVVKLHSGVGPIGPLVADEYIYDEDFSSLTTEKLADAGITASGSVVVEKEALKLTREGTDTTAKIKYTEKGMTSPTGYTFNLKKSNSASVAMMRTDCGALQFYWHAGGDLVIYNGTKSDWYKGVLDKNEVLVWVLSNPELDKHSLWIDGYEVGTWNSVNNRTNETNELSFTLTGADGNLMIDDFKVFDSTVPVSSLLAWTEGIIRDNIPLKVKSDIEFIKKGVGGSLVEWKSSNENIISLDGKIVRGEEDVPVTLTATITNSGETRTAVIDVVVAKLSTGEGPISPVIPGEYIYREDFSNLKTEDLKDADIETNGIVEVENEALKITREGKVSSVKFNFFDGETLAEPIGFRFKLKKTNPKSVVLFKSDVNALQFYWHSDGNLVIYNGTQSDWYNGTLHKNEIEVSFLTNPELDLHSLWIDDYKVDSWNSINPQVDTMKALNVILSVADGTLTIDDVEIFNSTVPEIPSAIWDMTKLTYSTICGQPSNRVTTNLRQLPTKGEFGSDILWSSSNESVISNEGLVTRSSDEHKKVEMTATIKNGEHTETKTFEFQVLKTNSNDVPPQIDGEVINSKEKETGKKIEIPLHPEGVSVRGSYAMSFKVDKNDAEELRINVARGEENLLETKVKNGVFSVKTPNELYAEADWLEFLNGLESDNFDITIYVNTESSMCSIWIDGEVVCEGIYLTNSIANMSEIIFESENKITVTEFKFFNPVLTDTLKVLLDCEYLMFSRIAQQAESYVYESFELPSKGLYGSDIVWASSEPDTLSENGTVVKPQSGSIELTLSAQVKSGDVSEAKVFNPTVVALEEDPLPQIKKMVFEDKVDTPEFSDKWTITNRGANIQRHFGEIDIYNSNFDGSIDFRLDTNNEENASPRNGLYGIEFIMHKSSNNVDMMCTGWDSGFVDFIVRWPKDSMLISYKPDENTYNASESYSGYGSGTVKVNILLDSRNKTFSVWFNNKRIMKDGLLRAEQAWSLSHITFSLQSEGRARFSNIKFYEAYAPEDSRVDYDYEWLDFEKIVYTDPVVHGANITDSSLNLVSKGYYGSDIEWESSNTNIISNDGTLNTEAIADSINPEVTLTAYISSGEIVREKQIKVIAALKHTNSADIVNADYELLTHQMISVENSDQIMMSLNLISEGVHGSKISWESSNKAYITQSGRVIRPRLGKDAEVVELTATISHGDVTKQKTLTFTVLPREDFVDPQHMTDQELFGVWDNEKQAWITEGKFDYGFKGFDKIEVAVKDGNYTLAKELLLETMKKRSNSANFYFGGRNTNWANIYIDGIVSWQNSPYIAEFTASNQWEDVSADIPLNFVVPGGDFAFSLMSWYNEASELQIISSEHPDKQLRPRLEIVVNGIKRVFEASEDATVRAGKYVNTNYGNDEYLKVKTFGKFFSDETYNSQIKFNLSELDVNDVVTKAKLILHCKAVPQESGEKRILIYNQRMTRQESELTWSSLTGMVYNFNGIPGDFNWRAPAYTDNEFLTQTSRFEFLKPIVLEYKNSMDERYAEGALSLIGDYITDNGGWLYSNGYRGAFFSSMDGGARAGNISACYDSLLKSPAMTPDLNAAIIKLVWDEAYQMMIDTERFQNQAAIMHNDLVTVASAFPEFKDCSTQWLPKINSFFDSYILETALPDGSYSEHTTGYNTGTWGIYKLFKGRAIDAGFETSEAFNDRLLNWAYYNMFTYQPNGETIQWGDGAQGFRGEIEAHYEEVAEWFGDTELQYIATSGTRGTMPKWTSKHYPDGKRTFMRANWSDDSPYLFTNVSGPGSHGHTDNNSVTISAYGRTLISDSGVFTYTPNDPYRKWGISAEGHNLVLINGEGQTNREGEIFEWRTSNKFDYLNQIAYGYNEASHNRIITFIKPNMFIVSDIVRPTDDDYPYGNEYKQLWHLRNGANPTVKDGKIKTNFASGGNIIVATADADAQAVYEENGWYGGTQISIAHAPYGYFMKSDVSKTATFDTVLMPYSNVKEADLEVTRLDTGTDTTVSTAMKMEITLDSNKEVGYFYLSHERDVPGVVRNFGKYETDAKMVYVSEKENGEVLSVIMKDGTYVLNKESDSYLIKLTSLGDVSAEMIGTCMTITASDSEILKGAKLKIKNTRMLEINGETVAFAVVDGYVVPYAPGGNTIITDGNKGDIIDPNAGGGASGGGASGGGVSSGGGASGGGVSSGGSGFKDIAGHWAEADISYLVNKGIIKGKTQDTFEPNSNITRAEFLALITRVLNGEASAYNGGFADVSSQAWYAGAVQYGLDKGLISHAENFRPNDTITREEMAKMVVEAYKLDHHDIKVENEKAGYTDVTSTDWSYNYIILAEQIGFMNGMGNGLFEPKSNATRAQSAVVIRRFCDK